MFPAARDGRLVLVPEFEFMRAPLPGRDYFPPRVLLRGITPSTMVDGARAGNREAAPRDGLLALRPGPALLPAVPPSPMMGVRPAAA